MAANATEKLKNKENYGPAVVTVQMGDKELQITKFSILANDDVYKDPFHIGELHSHECVYDEGKKLAQRILEDGTIINVENEETKKKFEKIAKQKEKGNKDR